MPSHRYGSNMIHKSSCNIIHTARDSCLTTNGSGLPVFKGYNESRGQAGGPGRRIHHRHQAIIPSYKFNCCGNITEWGVDLNPDRDEQDRTFNFILQVWRPSSTLKTDSCYSLINDHRIMSTVIKEDLQTGRVAKVTTLPQNQLQFEPGDVLGFYVESHGSGSTPDGTGTGDDDNGVVVLNDSSHTSELVWHGRITSLTSRSGGCSYCVGTSGLLNTSTHAAPVISISAIMATICLSSNMHSSSALLDSMTSAASLNLTRTSTTVTVPLSPSTKPNPAIVPGSSDGIIDNALIIGIVTVVAIFVVVSIISATIIIAVVIAIKRQSRTKQAGMALSNQFYGESA